MRRIITERNLVVVLFVMVIVTFSFAERDTKKIEHLYIDVNYSTIPTFNALAELNLNPVAQTPLLAAPVKTGQ